MKKFRIRTYEMESKKMAPGERVRFALLADLHGVELISSQGTLPEAVCRGNPDAVLVLGDMIVSVREESLALARELLEELVRSVPVFYAPGNHESRMARLPEQRESYLAYEKYLTRKGVCFLHNERLSMNFHGTDFVFYGLELPREFYRKPCSPRLPLAKLEDLLGVPSREGIQVLLAHNPKYGGTYFAWGADLTFSGHYHGGVMRLGEHAGLVSPQFLPFPSYCCGDFHRSGRHMIVSAGLGEHTVPVRIHNPRELIFADICGKEPSHGDSRQA